LYGALKKNRQRGENKYFHLLSMSEPIDGAKLHYIEKGFG